MFFHVLLLQIRAYAEQKKVHNITGPWLESQVTIFLTRELGLDKIVVNREIGNKEDLIREIDLAFVYRGILFVLDCKAMAKDLDYLKGKHSKIRNRITTIIEELDKCQERIALIKQGSLPEFLPSVDFILAFGLICTSAVEYLPLDEKRLWYENHPLVGTPDELLVTIRYLATQTSLPAAEQFGSPTS